SSRWDHHNTSLDAGSTRQLDVPTAAIPDWNCVGDRSSSTVRTSPVAASATRRTACLWSRDELMNASRDASGYHCTSRNRLPSAMWSLIVERCASGGIWSRITRAGSTSMITRWIRKITLSDGSGYRHASSRGAPTFVVTRYILLTPRESCWNVAIFFESGDQSSTGASLRVQPALLVA